MSREMTADEVRTEFLEHIHNLIEYWDNESRAETPRAKLEGLAFSMLVTLDGGSGGITGFIVAPLPHEDDKEYRMENDENWYPENHESDVNCDIGGILHERFWSVKNAER